MFSLSQFLLNYDTFPTQNAKKIWRQGGFFGSLDVPKFVMKFGISFVQTAVIDANVLVFRTVDSLAAPFVGEKEKFSKKQLRLFLLPFSLFLYQRGIGNRGFKDIGFFSRSTSLRNRWLTEKALKFINNKSDDNDCSLEKLSFKALSGNKIDSNKCANAKCHKKGY